MNDGISFEIPCRNEEVEDISINPICGKPIDYESANLPIPLHIWAAAKPRTYSEVNRGGDVARVWQRRGEWDIALGFVFDGLSPENQEDLDAYRSRVDGNTRFFRILGRKRIITRSSMVSRYSSRKSFFQIKIGYFTDL